MKSVIRSLTILVLFSMCAQPCMMGTENEETRNPQPTKSVGQRILQFPFVLTKNVAGGVALLGVVVTGIAAYLWLVKEVNVSPDMDKMVLKQLDIEKLAHPTVRQLCEWWNIEAYKNIDWVTVGAAGITTLATILYSTLAEVLA